MATCPGCRTENIDGAKFCNSCGKQLTSTCPKCQSVNPNNSRFCNSCGGPISDAAGQVSSGLPKFAQKKHAPKIDEFRQPSVPYNDAAMLPPKEKGPGIVISIIALLLNVFIFPGLGSIIAGQMSSGTIQLSLSTGAFFCILWTAFGDGGSVGVLLSIIFAVVSWCWGVITGLSLVSKADK